MAAGAIRETEARVRLRGFLARCASARRLERRRVEEEEAEAEAALEGVVTAVAAVEGEESPRGPKKLAGIGEAVVPGAASSGDEELGRASAGAGAGADADAKERGAETEATAEGVAADTAAAAGSPRGRERWCEGYRDTKRRRLGGGGGGAPGPDRSEPRPRISDPADLPAPARLRDRPPRPGRELGRRGATSHGRGEGGDGSSSGPSAASASNSAPPQDLRSPAVPLGPAIPPVAVVEGA